MTKPCDACRKARVQCRSVRSGSAKCFRCTIHKHDCVVKNRSHVNTLEAVFVPETRKFGTFYFASFSNLCLQPSLLRFGVFSRIWFKKATK